MARSNRLPASAIGRGYLSYVGATPFYLAAKGADLPLMRLLVEHGADPLDSDGAEGHPADGRRRTRILGRRESRP